MNVESVTLKGNFSFFLNIGKGKVVLEGFEGKDGLYYRTRGLKKQFGYEIEFNLSLEHNEAVRILNYITDMIFSGVTFEDNVPTSELTGAPVLPLMMEPKTKYYDDEKVFRIIFSDESFKLPTDNGCHSAYAKQLE